MDRDLFGTTSVVTDHGDLEGLDGDDHPQYILVNGTRDFTGSQNIQNLLPVTDSTYHIGDATYGIDYIQHPETAASGTQTARAGHHGGRSYGLNSDIFWGADNVFKGFYSQRSLPVNDLTTTGATDYSNLYQGDSTSPLLDINYAVGSGIDTTSLNSLGGAFRVGYYDTALATGGMGMEVHGRAEGRLVRFYYDVVEANEGSTKRFNLMANTTLKAVRQTTEYGIGGDQIEAIIPIKYYDQTFKLSTESGNNDNAIDLGKTASRWKDGYFAGVLYSVAATFTGLLTTSAGRIKNTTRVTDTYTIQTTDDVVFCDTASAYTVTLPAGAEGQTLKIINSGTGSFTLTVAPASGEKLIGITNNSFFLYDGESLDITYNTTEGWY